MTEAELEALIIELITTGGRRISGAKMRQMLTAMVRASVSSEDYPITSQVWQTEDGRLVRMTIDGTNQIKITDI